MHKYTIDLPKRRNFVSYWCKQFFMQYVIDLHSLKNELYYECAILRQHFLLDEAKYSASSLDAINHKRNYMFCLCLVS